MNFIKNVLASAIGTFVAMLLVMIVFFFIIVGSIASAITSGTESKKKAVKENSVLHLKLDNVITDRALEPKFNFTGAGFESSSVIGLDELIGDIKDAKSDDKIKGIFLETEGLMAAPSSLLDIRNALLDFKSSGKFIVAYNENYSQANYYVSSAASEVYMFPSGTFDWRGLVTEISFLKKMFDKLEIDMQVVRGPNNKFKSAVEPFMYEKMSPENREQIATFIGDIWKTMLDGISTERKVSIEVLNKTADSLTFVDNNLVKSTGMIDGLVYRDEVMTNLREKLSIKDEKEDINFVSLFDYEKKKETKENVGTVAIVYAIGAIESGEGDDQTIGSDRIAKALREAREDENVKAVVLRVNSPGGSALASDVIWRETELIKKSGKPFVVSMGDYAASGGYYIACSADKIFANPTTITGSIGVFGVIPNAEKFLENKIGITFDRYQTNAHANLLNVTKPLDEYEMKIMETMVANIYNDFTSKVAAGRKKTQAEVDSIGQGRVWSGEDALALGLVDEMGDLNAAVKAAAQMAGIADYDTENYPEAIDPFKKLMEELSGQKEEALMREVLGNQFRFYEQLKSIQKIQGVQARMPYLIEIY